VGLLGSLVACTSLEKTNMATGSVVSGRLAVRVEARDQAPAKSMSANFDLQGSPSTGQLNLSSPLGSVMAQARWSSDLAVLRTPDTETSFANLDELTQNMLGESLPVAALFDWLRGRPWSQAPSQLATDPAGFEQLGWRVDTSRLDAGWLIATRNQAPVVTLKARLDL
jgi:outer membrane lipoprotein LolB